MPFRRLRFIVLLLAALTLTMEAAHVLELPQKMRYGPELYSAVNSTMYRYFALVGGPLTVLTLLSGAGLVIALRHQPGFRWTLAGVLAYFLAFGIWLAVVQPVNRIVAAAFTSDPGSLPQLWTTFRARWEYGHTAGFVFELLGLACLLWSVLARTPVLSSGMPHKSFRAADAWSGSGTRVRPLRPDEWRLYRALRLEALRDAPDAFGSTLAREEAFPEQEWITRLAAGATSSLDRPLVAEHSGRPAGLAWVRIDANAYATSTLYQVWVHPEFRGRGIGKRLLADAVAWARQAGATSMVLCVACGPDSALEFYRKAGFVEAGKPSKLRPGSELMQQPMRRAI